MVNHTRIRLAIIVSLTLAGLSSCIVASDPYRELEEGQVGHAGSGLLFPEKLGAFQRGEFSEYDEAGLDVGVQYTRYHPLDQLNATIFVYPGETLSSLGSLDETIRSVRVWQLEKAFEGVKQQITDRKPGAKIAMEDDSVVTLFGEERDVKIANFLYTEQVGPLKITFFSTASLIAMDQWLVLFRVTAPDDCIGRSMPELSGLFQEFMKANGGRLQWESAATEEE